MFTGLISGVGQFERLEKSREPILTILTNPDRSMEIGDSVAVNGSCLSIIDISKNRYSFNISGETLNKTNILDLKKGDAVNVELPLTLNDLVSGHLLSGHVDGVARVKSIVKKRGSVSLGFGYTDSGWKKFIVNKGSIAVNGVSLTVNDPGSSTFYVEVIPITFEKTNLKYLKAGERVNIELDLVGKYLYNQVP